MTTEIIIVEQSHVICECLNKSLRKNKIRAKVFSLPVEAYEWFLRKRVQRKPPDLIFMDCDFPMDGGQQIATRIRKLEGALSENQKVRPVQIIGTTTRAWYGWKDGKRDGFDIVKLKPCGPEWANFVRKLNEGNWPN